MTPLDEFREKDLFQFIKENYIEDLEQTEQYSYDDATSEIKKMHIELKCRYTHYDDLMIEKKKYDKLIIHKRCRYICSTPEGIYSFNLHKIDEPQWEIKKMPRTTEFGSYYEKIDKEVGYLHISKAKKLG
jgi:hypothetical protein